MASKEKISQLGGREAPPALIVVAVVIGVIAIGSGGYYAYNGGWKTRSQQDYQFQHEVLPIYAAKHGNTTALETENKLRKERGESALEVPKEKGNGKTTDPDALRKLQEQLTAHGGGGGGGSQ